MKRYYLREVYDEPAWMEEVGYNESHEEEYVRVADAQELARAVLTLADDGGMPDSFKATDSRLRLARSILPSDERG